jgi:hypothetical protein
MILNLKSVIVLEDLQIPVRHTTCRVRTVSLELADKDKPIFESAVMNPEWPCKTLQNELLKRGVKISDTAIKQHREKRCSCWKT